MLVSIPRNIKYKKIRKRVRIKKGKDLKMNNLNNSVCGLKILKSGFISMTVFEAVRRIIRRKTKKIGKLNVNGFPYIPITKKPTGLRMGKGVGNIDS
jgi:large subunit ribosomal protein L16